MGTRGSEVVADVPKVVCLFAGGGGLFLGFMRAGFETLLATDIEPTAGETFSRNSPDVRFHVGDIRHLTPAELRALVGESEVDVVVGGPPCQGFSTIGDQIQGDPRNSLFEAFARTVQWVQPKCILIENTSYLRSQYGGQYEKEIVERLGSLGYTVSVRLLDAASFGSPQVRKRLLFFGTRLGGEFVWPAATHGLADGLLPYATVGDAIMDIANEVGNEAHPNHIPLVHSEKVLARYRLIPEGGRLPPPQFLPVELRRRNFGSTYKRLHRAKPSLTLVPGNNAFPIHPTADRSLTPREAARLQGFPDSYVFAGNRAEQCKLVGNAVPVHLATALAEAIGVHLQEPRSVRRVLEVSNQSNLRSQFPLLDGARLNANGLIPRRNSLTAASFFTGAGGLMLGFVRAGFEVLYSTDRKASVHRNLELNFPGIPHVRADVFELNPADVQATVGNVDVVFGGPPCEGFSLFGNRRFVNTRGHQPEQDSRNDLGLKYVELALALSPKLILMENVAGILSTQKGGFSYFEEITEKLKASGYKTDFRVLNAADYGVPQLRRRVILVAYAAGVEVAWPAPKYFAEPKSWQKRHPTVGDVISDLADSSTYDAEFNHMPMKHRELVLERYSLIPEGGKLPEHDLPEHLRRGYRSDNVRNYSHVYKRLDRNKPAGTLVPGHNAFPIHPTLPRALTVREAARIQTFPDSMRFAGTRQQQCTLVGNAVPPVLAEVLAQMIAKALRGNARSPGYKLDHYELRVLAGDYTR